MQQAAGISVALLRPLADLLERIDGDGQAFLHAVGVTEAMPPNHYLDAGAVDAALEAVAANRADPAFALTLAQADLARPLGLFGHLVWLSGTVRDALQRAAKFYAVVSKRSVLTLDESRPGLTIVTQTPRALAVSRGHILTEFAFASMALRARAATNNRFTLRAVRFSHAGRSTAAHHATFGVPVSYGAGRDQLEMTSDQLDLRLSSADAITSAAIEAQVTHLTQQAEVGSAADEFLADVRRAILSQPTAATPLSIAKQLAISPRTLRRQLELHGTSLRDVTAHVRCLQADALLQRGSTVKEVAFALGFSEPSAFSRAYKRWTGTAPTGQPRARR